MSKRWIEILLIISLAFNLAVLGMFIYTAAFHKPLFTPPGWQQQGGRNQNYGENHAKRMDPDAMLQNKEEIKQLREAFQQSRKDFIQTMSKDNFNLQEARAAMEKSLAAQDVLERKLGESLLNVRTKMTAAEAKRFFDHRLNRMNHNYRNDKPQDDPENNQTTKTPQGETK
jgi:hypothetical protein